MGEQRIGGAGGLGESSGRASDGPLEIEPFVPATQREIANAASCNKAQLAALIKRITRTPGLDLKPLLDLPPKALSFLATTQEWQEILDAMAVLCVADRGERYTRSQWKGILYFKTRAPKVLKTDDKGEPIEVEAISGESPLERQMKEDDE